jgi:hypothetical protein
MPDCLDVPLLFMRNNTELMLNIVEYARQSWDLDNPNVSIADKVSKDSDAHAEWDF